MRIEAEQVLCRFQLSNLTRHGMGSLYEWIVDKARRVGLQGATVLEGFYGLKTDGTLIEVRQRSTVHERPVIVEVVDEPARIEVLLAHVEPVFREGIITLERAHVVLYRAGPRASRSDATGRTIITTTAVSAASGVQTMNLPDTGVLLRIFIGESDKDAEHGRPLYEAIVRRAREAHLAGATVLRGAMGYGRHSRVHTAKFLEMSVDLPIVIEIVDAEDKVNAFLPVVDELVTEGLVTLEAVRVVRYVSPEAAPSAR
jgi:PII-like signaling protein